MCSKSPSSPEIYGNLATREFDLPEGKFPQNRKEFYLVAMPHSNPADNQRIYHLYHYLFACLAMKQKADGKPNYTAISTRLGDNKDLRKTISRLLQEERTGQSEIADADIIKGSNVTTGDIVAMLIKLRQRLQSDYQQHDEPYTRVLTLEDILTVLYGLIELTPEERQELGISVGDGLTLLQRALLILQTIGGLENYEMIFRVYKSAVGLDCTRAEPVLQDLEQVDELIVKTVETAMSYLPDRQKYSRDRQSFPGREETVLELTQKAQREIRRLLARSGNQQSPVTGNTVVNSYIRHYFQPAFVSKLAQTVVANERLTDQYPVYLKRITIEACGPLPFADKELGILQVDGPYPALLHPALKRLDQEIYIETSGVLPGPGDYELASQEAMRVTAEFYVKVPEDYQSVVERVFLKIASGNRRRIDFSLSSTGIGGALSHVIKVINTALLADIACISNYFPIAHDVTSTQDIIRDNVPSPVWAHSLVKLCRKETVGRTIQSCSDKNLRSYEEFAFADPIGHGDYCGFDFLASQAQAALQARLQAVRNTGVSPSDYIRHLCQRTEHRIALDDAWSYLQGYPFSSLAMIGVIDQEILRPNVGDRPLTKDDPYVYFDACISVIEALLDEGSYRRARQYLERLSVIDTFVQQGLTVTHQSIAGDRPTFEVFSGTLIVRYLLCIANYCYIYDTNNRDERYLPPGCTSDINREGLIRRAWTALDQAQQHIGIRLRKYVVINEISQGTFYPHYCLLGRIAFLRSKLLLFFPLFVPKDDRLPTDRFSGLRRTNASIHWGRLFLLEKARLYAAANGDSEQYACYASMQCWAYLIAVHASLDDLTLPGGSTGNRNPRSQTLSREQCLDWAKQMRNHALISYADTGRRCYYQIKEKSGLPNENDEFGPYRIQKIPAIYEARGSEYEELSSMPGSFLVFDMSLLAVNPNDLPKISPNHPIQTIYLFGTNACYLFFARGMYLLCSDASEEFKDPASPNTPIRWDSKLKHATRLLNMSWAIAEEGGEIHKQGQEEIIFDITRKLAIDTRANEYTSQDINSVRDLYPRRITEIADLGKVFSAVCMVLRLHIADSEERDELFKDIQTLLDTLHSAHHLTRPLRALLARQNRHNGHLENYLSRAKAVIIRYIEVARDIPENINLKDHRDSLLRELFSALLA
ncbi:MAG: hypothetical protein ACFE0J_22375 [Elainellaceae cyanobacterium]